MPCPLSFTLHKRQLSSGERQSNMQVERSLRPGAARSPQSVEQCDNTVMIMTGLPGRTANVCNGQSTVNPPATAVTTQRTAPCRCKCAEVPGHSGAWPLSSQPLGSASWWFVEPAEITLLHLGTRKKGFGRLGWQKRPDESVSAGASARPIGLERGLLRRDDSPNQA